MSGKKIGIIILLILLLPLLAWVGSIFVFMYFDDTTITFQNDLEEEVNLSMTIVEVESYGIENDYDFTLGKGEKHLLEVIGGIKRIKYKINQTEGVIEFDMWNGEEVLLKITPDHTLEQFFENRKK